MAPLPLALLLACCGTGPAGEYAYTSAMGSTIYAEDTDPPSKAEVDEMEAALWEQTRSDDVPGSFDDLTLLFVASLSRVEQHCKNRVGGCYIYKDGKGTAVIPTGNPCPYVATHEVMHHALGVIIGNKDKDHTLRPIWYSRTGPVFAVAKTFGCEPEPFDCGTL